MPSPSSKNLPATVSHWPIYKIGSHVSASAHKACLLAMQVLNAYGKVFPTQPPSGRHVREDSSASTGRWERHTDQPDIEAPQWQSSTPTRKKSIGSQPESLLLFGFF